MSMTSIGKTQVKTTCILYCKVPQRVAKEILSPGSLLQNHYHGKCFNLRLYSAENNKQKKKNFFCHVPINLKVDRDIRQEPSIFLHLHLCPHVVICSHNMAALPLVSHKCQAGRKWQRANGMCQQKLGKRFIRRLHSSTFLSGLVDQNSS